VGLFYAVSGANHEWKDRRTDEHYGIERTATFDLGWDGNSVKGGAVMLQRAGQGVDLVGVLVRPSGLSLSFIGDRTKVEAVLEFVARSLDGAPKYIS
jgi:hypothetical protein